MTFSQLLCEMRKKRKRRREWLTKKGRKLVHLPAPRRGRQAILACRAVASEQREGGSPLSCTRAGGGSDDDHG